MGSMSIWHWLIVLVVVMLVFGTKRIKNIGTDLGAAIKGFKEGVKDGVSDTPASHRRHPASPGPTRTPSTSTPRPRSESGHVVAGAIVAGAGGARGWRAAARRPSSGACLVQAAFACRLMAPLP